MMLEPEIEKFISQLVARIRNEGIFASVMKDLELGKTTWDKASRKIIGEAVKELFQQSFPGENAEESVYVEGEGRSRWWKTPYKLFGSWGIYPDIGILRPQRIAIELDHGKTGSRLKMALAKASFGYISGDWNYCFVFFHNQSGKTMKSYLEREIEKKILQKYEEEFHTKIILIE